MWPDLTNSRQNCELFAPKRQYITCPPMFQMFRTESYNKYAGPTVQISLKCVGQYEFLPDNVRRSEGDLITSKNLFNSVQDWHYLSCLLAFTWISLHIETEASNLFPQWNVQCYFYKMILPTQHYLQETDLAINTEFRIQLDIWINCSKLQI